MTRLTLGGQEETTEAVELELWERVFVLKPITRSVQRAADEIQQKLADEDDSDEAVRLFGELLDAISKSTNGQRKTAGQLINEKWLADELSLTALAQFVEQVREAADQQRPT